MQPLQPSESSRAASGGKADAEPAQSCNAAVLAQQCAVVIASCDSYSQTWEPYGTLFQRFWPDCPFPVYLVSNEEGFCSQRILSLRVGADVSWSDTVLAALSRIREEYVILMVDDFFLARPVDSARIAALLEWMDSVGGNCVHLYGRPRPKQRTTDLVGRLPKGVYYRASAVSCLWRKSVLSQVLRPGETAWDFEIYGSIRSNAFDGFYSALRPCFSFINGIVKGKWHPHSVSALRNLGVMPDCRKRGLLSTKQRTTLALVTIRSRLLSLLPLQTRWKVKALLLRGRLKYERYT